MAYSSECISQRMCKQFVHSRFEISLRNRRRSLLPTQTTHGPPGWTRRAGTFPRSARSRSRSYEVPALELGPATTFAALELFSADRDHG